MLFRVSSCLADAAIPSADTELYMCSFVAIYFADVMPLVVAPLDHIYLIASPTSFAPLAPFGPLAPPFASPTLAPAPAVVR